MWKGPAAFDALEIDEAMRLLASESTGRIAFELDGSWVSWPVEYYCDGREVVTWTGPKTDLARPLAGLEIGLEVDGDDVEQAERWSMTVVGTVDRRRATEGTTTPAGWAHLEPDELLRLRPTAVTRTRVELTPDAAMPGAAETAHHPIGGDGAAAVRIELLGPVRVVTEDGISPVGPRAAALLAALVAADGHEIPADELADWVWDDCDPPSAPKALQMHIVHLRRLLGHDAVVTLPHGYALDRDRVVVDVDEFESDLAGAAAAEAAGDHPAVVHLLQQALGRWRGPALSGLDGGRAMALGAALEERQAAAEEDLAAALLSIGDVPAASQLLESLVSEAPYREHRWELLMVALYRQGRRAEALATYGRARDVLVRGVGIEPGPRLVATERMVLDDDEALLSADALT